MKLELRADVLDQAIAVADQLHMTPDDVIALALTELVQRHVVVESTQSADTDYTLTAEEQAWLRYGRRVQRRLTAEEQRWLDAVWEYNAEHLEREEW